MPTAELLPAHRAVAEVVMPVVSGYWPYYRPDALMAHCTLATGVTDTAAVADAVAQAAIPLAAVVETVGLIEIPSGRSLFEDGKG